MPHLTLECSANVASMADIDGLVDAVHDAVLATGHAPADALRTRATICRNYAVADRHPANAFVAALIRIGPGRTADQKRELVNAIVSSIDEFLGPARSAVMISAECQEIDPAFRVNQNNLRAVIAARHEE